MADFLLGIDIGSSSIKTTLLNSKTGKSIKSVTNPKKEMDIMAPNYGWAEQNPEDWWKYIKESILEIKSLVPKELKNTKAIGITYQMHGLVVVDSDYKPLRPAIIWCDSRAVKYGNDAFEKLGKEFCLQNLLNSPGNFTASKLAWVKNNEKELYDKIYKIMLPGDYIAMKLTGEISTTKSGLSEGILWDFVNDKKANFLIEHFGFDNEILPDIKENFDIQSRVTNEMTDELGLPQGVPITYRAGDQPNNAFSLNVLNPGEIATTAGTSGVVYGIVDKPSYDKLSRVNSFVHVNHSEKDKRYGILMCLNGTGILNRWLKQNIVDINNCSVPYKELDNEYVKNIPIGSEGLVVLPYGNGAERTLNNKNIGSIFANLDFNRHTRAHILRAGQEGIVFALNYGVGIMKDMGMKMDTIKAGYANMFLSTTFTETFANVSGANVELYSTDGSEGAARGAGVGAGVFNSFKEAFENLELIKVIEPSKSRDEYLKAYDKWLITLKKNIN
jgi:xylulokinase